jgi:hypothetical protein
MGVSSRTSTKNEGQSREMLSHQHNSPFFEDPKKQSYSKIASNMSHNGGLQVFSIDRDKTQNNSDPDHVVYLLATKRLAFGIFAP